MNRRTFIQWSSYGIGSISLMLMGCRSTSEGSAFDSIQAAQTLRLESQAIAPDGSIPPDYTCDGESISPDLRWDAPPAETRSLAIVMDDPDAPGQAFAHWLVYNLPPETRQITEARAAQLSLPQGAMQGKNDFGQAGYGGPCPPAGTHRYVFRLYALDTRLDLAPGASKRAIFGAIQGHVLASGQLIG
jgi:Raf kinase inhibitor-like YbhB/YbcL family protein